MDCECFMFTSSKNICSHTVAVSKREDILPMFLDWVSSSADSECNLYELFTKNVNVKASGKKPGSRTQTRKPTRKEAVSYRVNNSEQLSTLQSTTANNAAVLNQAAPPLAHQLRAQSSVATTGNPYNILPAPQPILPQYHPTSYQQYPPCSTAQHHTQQANLTPWQNTKPFTIMSINGRIKKCTGCKVVFTDPNGPLFLGIVIQHYERDTYYKAGQLHVSTEQARYYHPEPGCLLARHTYFNSSLLQVSPGMVFNGIQCRHMGTFFGIRISPNIC